MSDLLEHVRTALENAWDQARALGWPAERLAVRVDRVDWRITLVGVRDGPGEWDRTAFEMSIVNREGELWVSSRWDGLPVVVEDLNRVDRAALAAMFPRWDDWRDARAVKGTIRRAV